jgi:hypothetical protein
MINKMKASCYICFKTNNVDLDNWSFVCKSCGSENFVKVPIHVQNCRKDNVGKFWGETAGHK